jgi:hypothetical protein
LELLHCIQPILKVLPPPYGNLLADAALGQPPQVVEELA